MCDNCGKEAYTKDFHGVNLCFECAEEPYQALAAEKSREITLRKVG